MKTIAIAALLILGTAPAPAQQKPAIDQARADAVIKSSFPTAPADWLDVLNARSAAA